MPELLRASSTVPTTVNRERLESRYSIRTLTPVAGAASTLKPDGMRFGLGIHDHGQENGDKREVALTWASRKATLPRAPD